MNNKKRLKRSFLFGPSLGLLTLFAAGACATSGPHEPKETAPLGINKSALEDSAAQCSDGIDNDLDGLVDCVDPKCNALPACAAVLPCDRQPTLFITNAGVTSLFKTNTSLKPFEYVTNGASPFELNAAGYNIKDGFIYGVGRAGATFGHLFRVKRAPGNTIATEDLTAANVGLGLINSFAGDVDNDGNYWAATGGGMTKVVLSTLTTTVYNTGSLAGADIAYNPDDAKLYSYTTGSIGVFNTRTNALDAAIAVPAGPVGAFFGAQWFDPSGFLFVNRSSDGAIFGINLKDGTSVQLGTARSSEGNDGATCAYNASKLEICGNNIDDDGDGTTDESVPGDGCIRVPDTDGDGIVDSYDLDDDNDGIPDVLEQGDSDGDGIPDRLDLDSDNDGIPDAVEAGHDKLQTGKSTTACEGNAANVGTNGICNNVEVAADSATLAYVLRDTDGDGVPDFRDVDSDNDGITDANEAVPNGSPLADADGDGRLDGVGGAPVVVGVNGLADIAETAADSNVSDFNGDKAGPDAPRDTDGDGIPDYRDLDSDNDSINDVIEAGATDADGDGKADGAVDFKGLVASVNPGAGGTKPATPDSDGDGRPNYRDLDSDNDGVSDLSESGAPKTADTNDDGVVDGPDMDKDGILDAVDGTPNAFGDSASPALSNPDMDALPSYLDVDSNNDGVFDIVATGFGSKDANNDGKIDDPTDADNDGIADVVDTKPGVYGGLPDSADTDGDGLSDKQEALLGTNPNDADSDDDGVTDGAEPKPGEDTDGDGLINALDPDSDNDGLFDGTELGKDCSNPATDPKKKHCIADADPATTTDPLNKDTDMGGVIDGAEDFNHNGKVDAGELNPVAGQGGDDKSLPDMDMDGLPDAYEIAIGTNPKDADSDDDGVLDGQEPNPTDDTDGDGLINALDSDSDNDGLFDGTELGKDCANPATNAAAGQCIADADKGVTKTSPLLKDTDKGGATDGDEDVNHNGVVDMGERDPVVGKGADDKAIVDTDKDGISDAQELAIGTNPNDADSDDDGVLDGDEPNFAADTDGDGLINALDPDSDNDGLFDGTELGKNCDNAATDKSKKHCVADADPATTTNPLLKDTDNGGVSDGSEDVNRNGKVDPGETIPTLGNGADDKTAANLDSDKDGLSDALEKLIGTNPNDADSDDDGVKDGDEANPADDTDGDGKINALDSDSDNDGLFDGTEVGNNCTGDGTDASKGNCKPDADPKTVTKMLVKDTDKGGVSDGDEDTNKDGKVDPGERNPLLASDDKTSPTVDSDGDGIPDDVEVRLGTDPKNPDSDGDGIPDGKEVGAGPMFKPLDTDGDGKIDALDTDDDGDGIPTKQEVGADPKNPVDTDKDGTPDYLDTDDDGDGLLTKDEVGPGGAGSPVDTDKDGIADYLDADDDNDGIPTKKEISDAKAAGLSDDVDGDKAPNWLDTDADGDGIGDSAEPTDGNGDGTPDYLQAGGGAPGVTLEGGGCACTTGSSPSNGVSAMLIAVACTLGLRRRTNK
jgi:Bacterial TSP3 repeat